MKVQISNNNVKLWLSANDTRKWANKPGATWPCSRLSGKRLFAEFDTNGLLDYLVNGRLDREILADEFNAITSDFLKLKLPEDHPCYFVTVGQYQETGSAGSAQPAAVITRL